ncbi:MAG: DNA repair protein RecN [Acidimicrobiia bacterium]|nr:DNA repair protein RecN [Acidimicrobiia bacterium]
MLDELAVGNLGLIAEARIEPGPGLIALTGETGAGKTLLLGALRLLRGDNARTDRIGPFAEETRVDGRFLIEDQELIVARRVGPSRSRAYIDGVMSPAGALTERLGAIVEIVGQHEHITLGRDRAVRGIVDASLDAKGRASAEQYRSAWTAHRTLLADREAIGGDRRMLERDLDLSRHQAREIAAAGFTEGEDAELAAVLLRLRHAEEIAAALGRTHAALGEDGAAESLGEAVDAVREASMHDAALEGLAARLDAAAAEVADVAAEVRRSAESLEHDPSILEEAEQRMAVLGDLRRKYGDTLDEVLEFGRSAEAEAARLHGLLDRADSLATEIEAAELRLADAGAVLSIARGAAAERLSVAAVGHLSELGFQDPVVRIVVEPADPGPSGMDRVKLLFASDAALEPGPVGRIASGGELSRLVLAIHLSAGVADVPVVAFDEIDAGIGGSTALAMGRKLADLAVGRQVFVVTHLPQVAAFADAHFVVERTGPTASVRRVEGEARVAELTRMLGGLPESERGRSHAAELIDLAVGHRNG